MGAPDDEITSLLLRHERTNKEKSATGIVIPGDDSDSDNRSDDRDMEQGQDNVGVMEDESDGDDDIPTISVGGEEFDITDVTPEIIAKMTSEEMEKYNQLYQD